MSNKLFDSFLKLEKYKIRFNYKSENHRSWFYCIATIALSCILMASSVYAHQSFFAKRPIYIHIMYLLNYVLKNCMFGLLSISFIVLLTAIHKRFAVINSILTYVLSLFTHLLIYHSMNFISLEQKTISKRKCTKFVDSYSKARFNSNY